MTLKRKALRFFAALTMLLIASVGLAWYAYGQIGKTPGELMDFAERRLQGHNKLEWVALPIIGVMRDVLNQPSRKNLLRLPFNIPPLSPLASTPDTADAAADLPTHPLGFSGRILRVGPFEDIRTIAQAAKLAQDGDIVEIQAGEYRGDVALWHQKRLVIRTHGGRVRLVADGKSAEGKAIWVMRNGDFHVDNIEFVGTRVSDRNGSGIRFEGGKLTITRCLFYANDTGLLVSTGVDSVTIQNSEFAYNGFGDGLSHNLYVNKARQLTITGSYFHHANVGHHIKSRAQNNYIAYNRITDESGGRASYEIDLPNGGMAILLGNVVQQGAQAQNSTLVMFGAEGMVWPENSLYLASNTLVNDQPYGGAFVRTASGTQRLISVNNLFVGPGKWISGPLPPETLNDQSASWTDFVQASRHDYRLSLKGQRLGYATPPMPELAPAQLLQPLKKPQPLPVPPLYAGAHPT